MKDNILNWLKIFRDKLLYLRIRLLLVGIISFMSYLLLSAYLYSETISSDLSKNLVRLHVIASSDSIRDQDIKYKVRDEILKYMQNETKDIKTAVKAKEFILNNMSRFENLANSVLESNGYSYKAKAYFGKFAFPTKVYGDVTLPAGEYESLRLVLGNGSGRNWWCVMFPPLCFVDASTGVLPESSKAQLKNVLSEEEYEIAFSRSAQSSSEVKLKFKVVEMLQQSKLILARAKK